MTTRRNLAAACAAAAALSACSDSSDGDAGPRGLTAFEAQAVESVTLRGDALQQPLTPAAAAQPAGSVSYDGLLTLNSGAFVDTSVIVGDLALTADFASSAVTGSATNFVNSSSQPWGGSLAVTNGTGIATVAGPPGSSTFNSDLAGTLTDVTGDTYAITGDLDGAFRGDGALSGSTDFQYMVGLAGGTMVLNGFTGPTFTGEFAAERQP